MGNVGELTGHAHIAFIWWRSPGFSAVRRPILTLTRNTSGGIDDALTAACDRYAFIDVEAYPDNCIDNVLERLDELGLMPTKVPADQRQGRRAHRARFKITEKNLEVGETA